jgi:hypothetical protein
VDITGTWMGHEAFLGMTTRGVRMSFQQDGARIVGTIKPEGIAEHRVEGTVEGDTVSLAGGGLHYHATAAGDRIDGMVTGSAVPMQFTVVRER